MSSYPAIKRWLAAAITASVLGAAIFLVARNPIDSTPLAAQGTKGATQDWIMYGGTAHRNMVNTAVKGLPVEWTIEKKDPKKNVNIKWFASLGSKAYGGPIIADGRVIIGTNNESPRDAKWTKPRLDDEGKQVIEKGIAQRDPIDLGIVMGFKEATGEFLWQAIHQKLPGGQVIDWPREGVCSTPHVEGDLMYYVSNRCEVICAEVKTGKAVWTLDMIGKLGVYPHNISDCSPLLVGDHLWVITSNGVDAGHLYVPAPRAPSFIKVDKKTGNVLWQDNSPTQALLNAPKGVPVGAFFKDLVNRGELIQHGQWANAAYGVVNGEAQVVFPGGDGWIYSFDTQGKQIWKFDCNPKDAKYALRTGERSDFISTPVIYKNRVYIGTGQDPEHGSGIGHFWCIDMSKKGDVSSELVTDKTTVPPTAKKNPNSAELWHYGGVIKDKVLVGKLGRNYYFGRTMSTAAIHDDIVYISELGGVLHCLDADKGTPLWEFDTRQEIWSSPYYVDGKVYLGNDDGIMFVFEHGRKLKKLAENDMGGRVRATPVAANGVLYVMTENRLYAISEMVKKQN